MKRIVFLAFLLSFLSVVLVAHEQTKIINFNQLPVSVQKAILKIAKKSSIKKVERLKKNGFFKYEVETLENGLHKDITLSSQGLLMEVEQQIKRENTPSTIKKALKKHYPYLKIKRIENVHIQYFEITGILNEKMIECKMLPNGRIIEKKMNEKEEDEKNENKKEESGEEND